MGEAAKEGDTGAEKSPADGATDIDEAYRAIAKLEGDFTAANYSRAPLALMKAGLRGAIDHRGLTANFRGLEVSFKPYDAMVKLRRIMKTHPGAQSEPDIIERFLGISQNQPLLDQK